MDTASCEMSQRAVFYNLGYIARKHILQEELQEYYKTLHILQEEEEPQKKEAERRRRNNFRRTSQTVNASAYGYN